MAGGKMYYNVAEYNKQKQQQGTRTIPEANYFAAVNHIRDMFEAKKMPYGVVGGLEMLCLGHRRRMSDLHIAYDDRDFARILAKLESDQRIRLPDGMNSLFPSKILLRTGPAYNDRDCTDAAVIEVNLLPPGSLGTPLVGMLTSNLVLLTLKPDGKLKTYKGLNMLHLVKTLVQLCRVPDLAWDPRIDVLFLCQHYSADIKTIQPQLDQKAIKQNFLGTSFFSKLSPEDRRICYQTLLGQEPPPSMTISPPLGKNNMYSQSGLKVPRSQIPGKKSSPATFQQFLSELPGNPMPRKIASQPNMMTSAATPPVELSASPVPSSRLNISVTTPQELPVSTMHSRSRYRPTSMPDSRNISVQNSSAAIRQRPTSTSTQSMSQKPMVTSQILFLKERSSFPPHPQQPEAGLFEMTPTFYNPGQPQLQTRLGLGGKYLDPSLKTPNQHPVLNNSIAGLPLNAHEGPHQPIIQWLGPTGIQSQTASQHASPADEAEIQRLSPNLAEVTEKLGLVGPEGLYPSQQRPGLPAQPKLSRTREQIPALELGSTQIIAELSAHIDAALNTSQSNHSLVTSKSHEPSPLSEPLPLQFHNQPKGKDSPVSPPETHIAPSTYGREPSKPIIERTRTAPLVGLPASLTAGRQGFTPQQHISRSTTQSFSPPEFSTTTSKYWNFVSQPPQPSSSSLAAPPQQFHGYPTPPQLSPPVSTSEYKAYRPASSSSSSNIPLTPPTTTTTTFQALPPPSTSTSVSPNDADRPHNFENLRDIDGKQSFLRAHRRDASHDSVSSNGSHESVRLAEEYQAELPDFGHGYHRV